MEIVAAKSRLPLSFNLLWSSKSVAMGMCGMLLMQFTYYATDIVGLSTGLVGVLLLASRLMDALFGLVVGLIVDKTHSKLGKGRPFDLFLVPMWVCAVFLFSTPDLGSTGKVIYVFAFYSLTNAVFTSLLGGGESAYLGRAIQSNQHRAQVTSISAVLVMLTCTVGSIVLPQLMAIWGTQQGGWTKISMAYAIPMCVLGLLRFFTIREQPVMSDSSQAVGISIKQNMKYILGNKYVFILAPAALLCNLTQTTSSIITTYYFTYIVGDLRLMSYVSMIGLLTPLILLLFPVAIRTIGGMNFVRIGLIISIVGNLLKLIDLTNLPLLVVSQLMSTSGLSFFLMMQGYFLLQTIDYGEEKFGKRVEGLSSAVNGLYAKIGAGLASVLVGGLMGVAGYINHASVQSGTANNTIVALYSWIPAVLSALILVTVHFYDLEKKLQKKAF